jgi:hypothetical protein
VIGFTSSFTTSIVIEVKRSALWLASLKTLSHRVNHTVKLQKYGSPPLMKSSTGEAELCQTGPYCPLLNYSLLNEVILQSAKLLILIKINKL